MSENYVFHIYDFTMTNIHRDNKVVKYHLKLFKIWKKYQNKVAWDQNLTSWSLEG